MIASTCQLTYIPHSCFKFLLFAFPSCFETLVIDFYKIMLPLKSAVCFIFLPHMVVLHISLESNQDSGN